MFLTLAYLLVEAYTQYWESRRAMRLLSLIKKHLQHTSVVLRRTRSLPSHDPVSLILPCDGCNESLLYEEKNKQLICVTPKINLSLDEWVSFLDCQNAPLLPAYPASDSTYVVFETHQASDADNYLQQSFSVPASKRVKVVDLVEPLAWRSGLPFGIVARCSTGNIAKLSEAFIQGTLCLDDMLELSQIITVNVGGQATRLLQSNKVQSQTVRGDSPGGSNSSIHSLYESVCEEEAASRLQQQQQQQQQQQPQTKPTQLSTLANGCAPQQHKTTPRHKPLNDSVQKLLSTYTDTTNQQQPQPSDIIPRVEIDSVTIDSDDLYEGSNESLASSVADLHDVRGDVDNFAQTVEEVMTLDGDVISEMMDTMAIEGAGEGVGGESLSGPVEELAPETLTPLKRAETLKGKPPNVLVYCGKKDSTRQFDAVKLVLEHCLNRDKYLIYHLRHDHVKTTPWIDNTSLLVIASEKAYDGVDQIFLQFFKQNGIVMSFGCAFDDLFVAKLQTSTSLGVMPLAPLGPLRQWRDVNVICGRHVYKDCDTRQTDVTLRTLATDTTSGYPVILEANHDLSTGVAILSQVLLEKDPVEMAISPEVFTVLKQSNRQRLDLLTHLLTQLGLDCSHDQLPPFTHGVLFTKTQGQKSALLNSIKPRLNGDVLASKKLSLHFLDTVKDVPSQVTAGCLPLVTDPVTATGRHGWCHDEYKRHLTTTTYGHVVIYADVMATTMNVLDVLMFSIPKELSVVAVAGRQTAGSGRGGNSWLSPPGCALFSVLVRLSVDTSLGRHMSVLQHVVSLAVIQAVTTLPGYQNLDLRLKWPNDIYYGSKMKIGGILVNSSIMQKTIYANIGVGVNVDNQNPTICINDVIRLHNKLSGDRLAPLSREMFIARTVNWLETLIEGYEQTAGNAFLQLYYQYWLHSEVTVRLEAESGLEVKVIGLDEYGYLLVLTPDGRTMSLHPDGNSFDMMKGLVAPKK